MTKDNSGGARSSHSAGQREGDEIACACEQKKRSRPLWKTWLKWLSVKTRQLTSNDKLNKDLSQMTERDLMDIGLIRSDIHRITRGILPPTDRPLK
jgi:uncharacterized protein YjiS (DUF1127 family)